MTIKRSLVFIFISLTTLSFTKTSFASSPFSVSVRPDVNVFSVKKNAAAKGWQTQFRIQCTVTNISNTTQEFSSWGCSTWENWKTNNSHVTIPHWQCSENDVFNTKLEPRKTLVNKFSLDITPDMIGKELKFKIAFVPYKKRADKNEGNKPLGTYWSKEIKIKVVE